MNLLEDLMNILTEAPMSAEDRADSDTIRGILKKLKKRPNSSRLNKKEQDVLDKYGLNAYNGRLYDADGDAVLHWYDNNAPDEVNFANRSRTYPERKYSKQMYLYAAGRHSYHNKEEDPNVSDIRLRDMRKSDDFYKLSKIKSELNDLENRRMGNIQAYDFVDKHYDEAPEFFNGHYNGSSKEDILNVIKNRSTYDQRWADNQKNIWQREKQEYSNKYLNGRNLSESYTCCICGGEFDDYGNNPYPYEDEGRCCKECNLKYVIPARLRMMNNRNEE